LEAQRANKKVAFDACRLRKFMHRKRRRAEASAICQPNSKELYPDRMSFISRATN